MAETTPAAEIEPAGAAAPAPGRLQRGTTRLSRLSGVLSWFVGTWFCFYGVAYLPLLIAGVLVIWLGIGAWKGRRRRTVALAAVTAAVIRWFSWAGPSLRVVPVAPGIATPSAYQATLVALGAGCHEPPATVSTPPTLASPVTAGAPVVVIVPGATGADSAETLAPVR